MPHILDLDLDFFVGLLLTIVSMVALDESEYRRVTHAEVETFLEDRCGLSKTKQLPGHFCTGHEDAFDTWADWIDKKIIESRFCIAPVGAR
ncbi:MAG TPA: hypothetical protein VK638_54830 [Edaphobacter sp.]|nr:hypothetical protein [Edaphobacter sp.]